MIFFNKTRIICWSILGILIIVLSLGYVTGTKRVRYLLFFQNLRNGNISCEQRYVPVQKFEDPVTALVSELLLGPQNHDFLRFADPETQANSCFVRGSDLYLDLPASILAPKIKTPDFHTVYELLKKNIFLNCKNVKQLYLYIDGRAAYETAYNTEE
ncbi:hypothetical protein DWQ65_11690 [Treponema phagedenis]|uniref:GerMN domain-containing protein n=1 Tax=Treponema phagedenis TaxID=162 RepID=A0A0B7H1V5_TREPH|nr:GerMN domain-containing protein [Treponema phagedenis]EFW37403.1 hypothetical protein HMPREF9554_02110 [Treponema phagedenis F0421]NVP23661.1 GerMN domain-containing protein [Treponema phagedenis]QEJ94504.1 GerMN domain-containing protein [Treponema phagedenis]QEJ98787.1 GerMN domain-containing protein [Treponema phagedenis]QEK01614.1 GerMN domain-containing protein [Treponema phagedenis]